MLVTSWIDRAAGRRFGITLGIRWFCLSSPGLDLWLNHAHPSRDPGRARIIVPPDVWGECWWNEK